MARHNLISEKIHRIMKEGVKGKKVKVKQAAAIAFSMARKGKLGKMASKLKNKKG